MRDLKEMWALICYAGSAPKASIGSKPIGSELDVKIGPGLLRSQENSSSNSRDATPAPQLAGIQSTIFIEFFEPQLAAEGSL